MRVRAVCGSSRLLRQMRRDGGLDPAQAAARATEKMHGRASRLRPRRAGGEGTRGCQLAAEAVGKMGRRQCGRGPPVTRSEGSHWTKGPGTRGKTGRAQEEEEPGPRGSDGAERIRRQSPFWARAWACVRWETAGGRRDGCESVGMGQQLGEQQGESEIDAVKHRVRAYM